MPDWQKQYINPQPQTQPQRQVQPQLAQPKQSLNGLQPTGQQTSKSQLQQNKFSFSNHLIEPFQYLPTYRLGEVIGNLKSAKDEMDNMKKGGYDNYAHRLGMCTSTQGGVDQYLYGLGLGVAKEGLDIIKKTYKGAPINETLQDSKKDMKNNLEGLNYGLQNPDKDCRVWLKNLDYKNNRWRKP